MPVYVFNETATTEIYTYCHTLSLHDALPIFQQTNERRSSSRVPRRFIAEVGRIDGPRRNRSTESFTAASACCGDGAASLGSRGKNRRENRMTDIAPDRRTILEIGRAHV